MVELIISESRMTMRKMRYLFNDFSMVENLFLVILEFKLEKEENDITIPRSWNYWIFSVQNDRRKFLYYFSVNYSGPYVFEA